MKNDRALAAYLKGRESNTLALKISKGHGIPLHIGGNTIRISNKYIVKRDDLDYIFLFDSFTFEKKHTITADDIGIISQFIITKDSKYLYFSDYVYGESSIFRMWNIKKMICTSKIEISTKANWDIIDNFCVDEKSESVFILHHIEERQFITEYTLDTCQKTGWELLKNERITALAISKQKKYMIIAISGQDSFSKCQIEVWDYKKHKKIYAINIFELMDKDVVTLNATGVIGITVSEYENVAVCHTNWNHIILFEIQTGRILFKTTIEGKYLDSIFIGKGHRYIVSNNQLINCSKNKITKLSISENKIIQKDKAFSEVEKSCIFNEIKLENSYKSYQNNNTYKCCNLELYNEKGNDLLYVEGDNQFLWPIHIRIQDLSIIKKDRLSEKKIMKYLVSEGKTIYIKEANTEELIFEQTGIFPYEFARLSKNEKYLFVYDESNVLSRYDIEGTECIEMSIPMGISKKGGYRQIVLDNLGRYTIACNQENLLLLNFEEKKQVLEINLPEKFLCYNTYSGQPLISIHNTLKYIVLVINRDIIFINPYTGEELCRLTFIKYNQETVKFIWQTPPDELAPNGWFYTNYPEYILVHFNNGNSKELIFHNDQRFIEYINTFNRKDMVINRLNNMAKYKNSISQLLSQKENFTKYKRLQAEYKLIDSM